MRRGPAAGILLAFCLMLFFVLAAPRQVFGHPGEEHNEELEKVLFDRGDFAKGHKNDDEGKSVAALEAAAYLCIDQFNNQGQDKINILIGYGVPGARRIKLSDLNPTKYNLSAKTHRGYTHRGWETTSYPTKENQERFQTRKNILLGTTEKIFDFSPMPAWMVGYDKKCNSLCALVYYVHVLGDYIEDKDFQQFNGSGNGLKIAFATPNPSDSNPDIFWELKKHLAILFADQTNSWTYRQLIVDLDTLAGAARSLSGQTGGINSEERYREAHSYAVELMALLTGDNNGNATYNYANRIHQLLMNEEFFTKAFPSA